VRKDDSYPVMVRNREEFLEDDLEKVYLEYMQEAVV
jgi:hypothetical protein